MGLGLSCICWLLEGRLQPPPRPHDPESQRRLLGAGMEEKCGWSVQSAWSSVGELPAQMVMVGSGPGSHRCPSFGQGHVAPAPREGLPGRQACSPSTPAIQDVFHSSGGLQLHFGAAFPFPRWGNRGSGFPRRKAPIKRSLLNWGIRCFLCRSSTAAC